MDSLTASATGSVWACTILMIDATTRGDGTAEVSLILDRMFSLITDDSQNWNTRIVDILTEQHTVTGLVAIASQFSIWAVNMVM